MISQQHKKKINSLADHAAAVFYEAGEGITKEQAAIAKTYYNRRTGALVSNLSGRNFSVMKTAVGAKLLINYLTRIRYLDLKKTSTGKKKKVHHPIYNKPIYGYIYGYVYSQLRYGLNTNVRDNFITPLKATFKKPIEL